MKEIKREKQKKEKKIERRLCAELDIIKVSYALPSILTNNVIFYESLQFQMRKFILVYIRKVFFEFAPVYNTIICGRSLWMQCKCCQSKQKASRKLHRKICERIKESKWGIYCKFMWIKRTWNNSFSKYRARTLFQHFLLKVQMT